jgi:hypothetical protein
MSQKYKRFRDYEHGLKAAYDNYKKWQDDPALHTLNKAYKNRPPTQALYIRPFATQGVAAASNVYYKVSVGVQAWNDYKAKIGARAKATIANTDVDIPKSAAYRPAKVIIKTGISSTPTEKTSHITKRKYKSYGGQSVSIPFGAKDAAEAEAAAVAAIDLAIGAAATTRVTFIPEAYHAA